MTKLLFDPTHCVVALPVVVDDEQRYILYSPDCFNFFAAMLTSQNKIDPEIALKQEGYCGIIAAQFIGTEVAEIIHSKTAEQHKEDYTFDISTAFDITNCSMEDLYDHVIAAIDALSFKLMQPERPKIH